MLIRCGSKRPSAKRARGWRLSIDNAGPEKTRFAVLQAMLEKALPHLKGRPLHFLILEYWTHGEPYNKINFDYYP